MLIDVAGSPVYCETGGAPLAANRPAAVFIHGALNDNSVWQAQLSALAGAGYAVLAPDLPGHGRSGGTALGDIEALAHWLQALLDTLALAPALLVGHSMGSLVALATAAADARIGKLALLGTACPMTVSAALLDSAQNNTMEAIALIARYSHAPGVDPALRADSVALMTRLAAGGAPSLLHTDLMACNDWRGACAAATALRCPTLFLLGEEDRMTPAAAAQPLLDALLDALPGARMARLSQCGHAMMAACPQAVTQALLEFARS